MVMKWQNISVPFAAGVDTKADSKALQPGKLANLENGIFTKRGSIIKRPGTAELSNDSDLIDKNGNARSISATRAVHASSSELLITDDSNLLTRNPTRDQWKDRGSFKSVEIVPRTVADLDSEQTTADCCTGGGYILYAWEDNRGGVYCHMVEESTRAVVIADRQVDPAGSLPKCVYLDNTWHVVYVDASGNTLYTYKIVSSDFAGTSIEIVTNVDGTNPPVDLDPYTDGTGSDRAVVAYGTDSGASVGVVIIDKNGAVLSSSISIAGTPGSVSISYEPNTLQFGLFIVTTINAVYATMMDLQFVATHGPDLIIVEGSALLNVTAKFHRDAGIGENTHSVRFARASSEGMLVPNSMSLVNRYDFTVEAWIRFDSLVFSQHHTIVATGSGTEGFEFAWKHLATPILDLEIYDSAGNPENLTAAWIPTVSTWYHVAVTRKQLTGEVKFYVDGSQQGATVAATSDISPDNTEDLTVGYSLTNTNHFNGYMDCVRVWSTARTGSEISGNRLSEVPGDAPSLQAAWRFSNNYLDQTGNNNAGSATGTPAFSTGTVPFTTYTGATPHADEYFAEVFYEQTAGQNWDHEVFRFTYSNRGNFSDGSSFMRHAGIASRAFLDSNDVCVHLCHQDDGIQNVLFGVMDDQTVFSKMLYGTHGGLVTDAHLPNVQRLDSRVFRMASIFRKRLVSTSRTIGSPGEGPTRPPQDNEVYSGRGVKELTMGFEAAQSHRLVQVGPTAYLNGGFIWQYDGVSPVESGFHLFPANVVSATADSTKEIPDSGAYFYKIYYEWTNARGERERSTFGAEVRADLSAGEDEVTLTIPTLSFTGKKSPRRDVSIVVYRTEKNPTASSPFYRVSSPDPTSTGDNAFLSNSMAADIVSFVDGYRNLADDPGSGPVLIEQELDYKNSAELDNLPPNSCSIIAEGKDRIFMAGFEDRSEVRFSKQHFAGFPVEFNDALKFTVPEDGGAITALTVLNGQLIILKRGRIYAVTGAGPNNVGGGQSFSRPSLITTNVGCIDQRSVVLTPMGIMFQSTKGIYLLTQQLQVQYIGADVELYNGQTFVSAELKADDDEVVFLAESGRTLVFNYLFGQWSTYTGYTGADAAIWNDTYVFAAPNGRVRRESSAAYTDAGAIYQLRIETAWIKLKALAGFQRIRRSIVTGEWRSSHKLNMGVAYDYEPARRDIVLDPTNAGIATTVLGDPAAGDFGDGTPLGSGTAASTMESEVYQFRVHLPRQKCQAVKFFFSDSPGTDGAQPEQAYELTELMLEVGVKRGTFKPSNAKTVG